MARGNKPIHPDDSLEVTTWQLPEFDGRPVNDENSIGREALAEFRRRRMPPGAAAGATQNPADQEDPDTGTDYDEAEELHFPTASELQAIRDAAQAEGREEGRQEGFSAGYAEGSAEGRKDGYDAGYAEGEQAGQEAAQAEMARRQKVVEQDLSARFGQAIAAINAREQAVEEEMAPILRDLVLRLAQGLVVQSLQQSPDQIETLVHDAIQRLPAGHQRLDIHLNPDDFALLETVDVHWLEQARLHADAGLSPGGCVVRTEHSLLDYSLDTRFQQQVAALLELPGLQAPPETLRRFSRDTFDAWVESLAAAARTDSGMDTPASDREADDPGMGPDDATD